MSYSYNGSMSAFQADDIGSNPLCDSKKWIDNSMVEWPPHKWLVVGSNPTQSTKKILKNGFVVQR